jgi:hypothetical protein
MEAWNQVIASVDGGRLQRLSKLTLQAQVVGATQMESLR